MWRAAAADHEGRKVEEETAETGENCEQIRKKVKRISKSQTSKTAVKDRRNKLKTNDIWS